MVAPILLVKVPLHMFSDALVVEVRGQMTFEITEKDLGLVFGSLIYRGCDHRKPRGEQNSTEAGKLNKSNSVTVNHPLPWTEIY